MNCNIRIQDPSGETRTLSLPESAELMIGRAEGAPILLRDPTAVPRAGRLCLRAPGAARSFGARERSTAGSAPSPWWIEIAEGAPDAELGDLRVREAHLPFGMPVRIGESKMWLEPISASQPLPAFPSGVRPWLTCTDEGRQLLWTAKKAAPTPLSLYLAGETGVGKEVMAHLIHAWSDRASGPFVPLHCGALPLSLAESELFGHVKGAFTGAAHHRSGALMQAHNGTLFLDEVGDLPLDIQVKLLRFLENGEIRPVGADRPARANVRLLCATHHPLLKLVEEGRFRRDLYYRVASVTIEIPRLRDRPDDVAMLARQFAGDLGRTLSAQAVLRLQAHRWPGNVRELRHAVERAAGLSGPFATLLSEEAFAFLMTPENIERAPSLELGAPVLKLVEMERVMILQALKLSKGNRAAAAKILGIARSTLFEKLKQHRIEGPRGGGG